MSGTGRQLVRNLELTVPSPHYSSSHFYVQISTKRTPPPYDTTKATDRGQAGYGRLGKAWGPTPHTLRHSACTTDLAAFIIEQPLEVSFTPCHCNTKEAVTVPLECFV